MACPAELVLFITSKCRLARICAFPANDGAGGFSPVHEHLRIHHAFLPRSDGETSVLSWSTSARFTARAISGGACSCLKASSASAGVRTILTPIAARGSVRFEDCRQTHAVDPLLEFVGVADHLCGRRAHALLLCQVDESRSRIDEWETLRRAQRALDQSG